MGKRKNKTNRHLPSKTPHPKFQCWSRLSIDSSAFRVCVVWSTGPKHTPQRQQDLLHSLPSRSDRLTNMFFGLNDVFLWLLVMKCCKLLLIAGNEWLLMVIDDEWWWFLLVMNGCWWLLMMNDGSYWLWMVVDGYWWWMVMVLTGYAWLLIIIAGCEFNLQLCGVDL